MNSSLRPETANLCSLKQAVDQINSVIDMLETDGCRLDMARKLNSLEKEICRLKRAFVNEHNGINASSGRCLP